MEIPIGTYCRAAIGDPLHGPYHDEEYGFPVDSDAALFERLILEINQAGLSWATILKKRTGFREAYRGFDIDTVAAFGEADVARLLSDESIIRNRLKVAAAIENARRLQAIRAQDGSFRAWLDRHHPREKSEWVKLFKKTFQFTGGEIVGEFLLSTGYLPGAHHPNCPVAKKVPLLLLPLLFITAIGCSKTQSEAPVQAAMHENRAFNDAARFLAGLPSAPASEYAELEKTPAWQEYASEMSEAWQKADRNRMQPVRAFQSSELGANANSNFVFYPFSGPDVVYMQAFYPNGSVYVLAGLERPGTILEPGAYNEANLEAHLDGIRRGSASLFERSFFVTGEMSRQLRGQLVDGVLPLILMLLARTGNTIENVRNVGIDNSGKLIELPKSQPKPGSQPDGLEVIYHQGDERKQRKLYYFRLDLGPGLVKNASFLTFLATFGAPETLIKSASFLLHWKTFTKLRDYIVANSVRIVQDDTGIRYEIFRKQGWRIRLYGSYGRPDRPFQAEYQKDLRDAFEAPGAVKPLGFSMGYGIGRRASHVIVAERP